MAVDLVTVPRVPILRTGHYDLLSGPVDFTSEHLQAAVTAFENDPAVVAPRVRVETPAAGHLEGDGIAAEAAGGAGGPALGWCDALEVAGDTLYADLHVPAELAACLEWAFPSRSIEGLFGFTTATGHTHDFLATGLLLLGTSWPGVSTLPDLHELEREFAETLAEESATAVAAGFAAPDLADMPDGAAVLARIGTEPRPPEDVRERLATAGLAVTDLGRQWYDAESENELADLPDSYDFWSWYVSEIRVDDDGTLYVVVVDDAAGEYWRFDVTSIDGAEVTFGPPQFGALDWRSLPNDDVATAAAGAGRRVPLALARWDSRERSRPVAGSNPPTTEESRPMTDAERRALAVSLGLSEDTSEADLHNEAARRAANPSPEGGSTEPEGSTTETETELVPATARTTTISRERLAELERGAAAGLAAEARQIAEQRTAQVRAAVADGRITPAEAGLEPQADGTWPDGWRRDMDDAPEVTARSLARLAPGKYPGSAAASGVQPQNDGAASRGGLARVLAFAGLGDGQTADTPQQQRGVIRR